MKNQQAKELKYGSFSKTISYEDLKIRRLIDVPPYPSIRYMSRGFEAFRDREEENVTKKDGNGWGEVGLRLCGVWWVKVVQGGRDTGRVEVNFFKTNAGWGGLQVGNQDAMDLISKDEFGNENDGPPAKARRVSTVNQTKRNMKIYCPNQENMSGLNKKHHSNALMSACRELGNLAVSTG
ncbi:hypothetical protein MTR67_018761 [Solanum verrucosum]|uniref:Uncharacterized protein n=1 Tax=Solanum verrucosum TaxID=315347 RepID=A0AAF0QRD3_SOLVR|nr:hypothetical protein MTR67_018761 [Solanum verrucosum]